MQWKLPGDPRHQASISARQPVSYCNFPYLIHLGCIVKPFYLFTDVSFGIALDSDIPRLLSLGQDRVLVCKGSLVILLLC